MARNWEYAARLFWPRLIEAAERGVPLWYEDLAPLFNTNPYSVGYGLGPIMRHCEQAGLPPLTAIVIGKTTGVPGPGFTAWNSENLDEAYREVFDYDWRSIENPFIGYGPEDTTVDFADRILGNPSKAQEVYAQVKVRGRLQVIFRQVMLEAYDYQCAFCGFSFEEALEAAHIVPWAQCSDDLRCSPRNGLLLCANHHRLFDKGYLTVRDDLCVIYLGSGYHESEYSRSDMASSVVLDGSPLNLPEDRLLWPDVHLLGKVGSAR